MTTPRFVMRTSRTETVEVALDRAAATVAPEALNHVASSVFESDDDERHHLRDAAVAITAALADRHDKRVAARLSHDEIAHVPEALRHVAHEIFRGGRNETLLRGVADAVEAAAPARGPRR